MRRVLALMLVLALPLPAAAQEEEGGDMREGFSLLEEGAKLLLRGMMKEVEPALDGLGSALVEMEPALRDLAAMIGDVRNYHAPEMLPNGDIIIRRRAPMGPVLPEPGPGGEIEL